MLRIPHCLDNRPRDGCKVVSPTHLPHFTPQKHYYFYLFGTQVPQGLVSPEGLGKFKNSPHRVTNLRPSVLSHSALTTTLQRTPHISGTLWSHMVLYCVPKSYAAKDDYSP
jgi:hypothetical protein